MRRHQQEWTTEDCEKLKTLVKQGASPFRASAALDRSVQVVKNKARELGCPFPLLRSVRTETKAILQGRAVIKRPEVDR